MNPENRIHPAKSCLFAHQKDVFAELHARARVFFEGAWHGLSIKTRWHSLVVGPTGTGKTAIAALLAEATGAALLRVSIPGWMPAGAHNRAVGETLPGIFRHITTHPRTILFLDELDKIYHETSWNSYVRGELFELLDGRWPVGIKTCNNDDDDDQNDAPAPEEHQTSEKLRNTTFILAAGTFQDFYDEQSSSSQIGFHSEHRRAYPASGPTAAVLAKKLPRELVNRFDSSILLIPPLDASHYNLIARQAEQSLPAWIQPAFRAAAAERLHQAIASRSGCRFVEEALSDALKNIKASTPKPEPPTQEPNPCDC